MDGVMADTLVKYLRVYNQAFGEGLTYADLAGYELEDAVPAERKTAARNLLLAPGFFRDVPVMAGAQEVVRALGERYEVFVASAAMDVPTSFDDKFAWLREHFPFIPTSHIVFCGDKSVLDVDYLIDDSPRHFAHFRGTPVLFTAPLNAGETRYFRVEGWGDVARLLLAPEAAADDLQPAAIGAVRKQ
jgi:5'(3')-deoxyribonucleotidase